MKPLLPFLAGFVFLFADTSFAAGKPVAKYSVQLSRPSKVGHKYRVIASGSKEEHLTQTIGVEENTRETAFEMEFRAVVTVLGITKKGQESKLEILIEKFGITEKGRRHEVLPKGTKLIATKKNEKKSFAEALDDGKVRPLPPGQVVEALKLVISVSEEESPTDDEVFGSRQKRAVGERWDVNKKAMIADLKKQGVAVKPGNMTGELKIGGLEEVAHVKCLSIEGVLKMKGVRPPLPKLFQVKKSDSIMKFSGKFPVDTKLPTRESAVESVASFTALAPAEGERPAIELTAKQHKQARLRFVPLD